MNRKKRKGRKKESELVGANPSRCPSDSILIWPASNHHLTMPVSRRRMVAITGFD
jgi:hypothetical protein